MNSSQYRKNQIKWLASILGSSPSELESIVANIDSYYYEWFEKKVDRNTGELKAYKDGTVKQRVIRPSLGRLKTIQASIKNSILAKVELPENVYGGVKGRNNITNAKRHQGNKYIFTTDLEAFFPNIKHTQVYEMFLKLGYSNHVSNLLTKLCTWKYELPQGIPVSTHIANLIFLDTDYKLIGLSDKNNLTYTRYVDDLTFSAQHDFREDIPTILQIVQSGNFKISHRKTKYKGKQTITGVEVYNNYIDAPTNIKIKAQQETESGLTTGPIANYLGNIRKTNKSQNKRKN